MNELAIALAFGLWAFWPWIGIWLIGLGAMNAIGRNPSAAGDVKSTMILAIAFAEALWIFAFVIAMILKFVE
jgi:F-type H+-transporting ATPase subunit c